MNIIQVEFKRKGAGSENSRNVLKWFCQYFPHWHKVLVHDLGDREIFGVPLPIFKDWRNSRRFSTRQYLFYCAPHFPGITSKENFQKRLKEFQKHLRERGYPKNLLNLTLSLSLSLSLSFSEIHFEDKKKALQQESSRGKKILPFVTQNQPSVPSLKSIFMKHWQLIENQLLLRQIDKEPPIISPKRGKSLKDILVL